VVAKGFSVVLPRHIHSSLFKPVSEAKMYFHGEREVLRRLRGVSVLLVLLIVAAMLTPWARVTSPGIPSLYADVGLTWCHSGPLCKALENAKKVSSSPIPGNDGDTSASSSMPPWATKFIDNQIESSQLYSASMAAMIGMGLTVICIVGAELVWSRFGYQSIRGLDYRVILQLASCGIFLITSIVYCIIVQGSLNEGRLLIGVYLSLTGGVLALCACIFILVRMSDMDDPLDVLEPKGVRYGAFASLN